ncbi:MAG: hypothetical protein EOO07_03120 [Chitinophagaceae bacterium]|nr:MAG: hypothetical protein EOO07_03120 [Chitinophagaceae bacterium]
MNKLHLLIVIMLTHCISFAQTTRQQVIISVDTVNISGKLVTEQGLPIYNALVLSETFGENHKYIQTTTDINGEFNLKGIKPTDRLRFRTAMMAVEYNLNGSRYLVAVMIPMLKLELNSFKAPFSIEAKRVASKEKYSYKTTDTLINVGFHPFGHYAPATYPGGLFKFYNFIKTNIVYPDRAIKGNVEGLVAIEFTIDRSGNYKDFLVVRDLGYGCAEEVLRVIKKSKKWNSAVLGNPVEQRISLQVPFKLLD